MNRISLLLLSASLLSASAFAGPLSVTPVAPPTPDPITSLFAGGFSLEAAGSWTNQPGTSATANSHGFGGELGLTYWLAPGSAVTLTSPSTLQLGLRLSADLANLSPSAATFSGDILTRMPLGTSSYAPYAFVGAGLATLGSPSALYHGGMGFEKKINANLSAFGEVSRATVNQPGTTTPWVAIFGLRYSR